MAKWIYLSDELLLHKAYGALASPTSYIVLAHFFLKRRMRQNKLTKEWEITNNGEIEFTYDDAEKLGISTERFSNAIRDLVRMGFLDITGGVGKYKAKTTYAMSDRWKRWGMDGFEAVEKPKRKNRGGNFYCL